MKTTLTILFLIFVTISFAQQDQTNWKSEFKFSSGVSMTTFLKVDKINGQFTITSPKNADKRLFGYFKAKMGRLFGKSPKKGILVTIKGDQKEDSLFGNAKVPMLGILKFKGVLKENMLNGELIKNDTIIVGTLTGVKTQENRIDFKSLYPKIIKTTQNNIYSKKVLQSKEWQKFQKDLEKLCDNAQDDIEIFLGFNFLSPKLPFSHYNFIILEDNNDTEELKNKEQTVIFEEKSSSIAYLKIKNFSSSQKELAVILPKIVENNYQNLIVDLRNNGGGGIEAAFEFGKYIMNNTTEVGYFVTNRLQYSGFDAELFEALPEVKPQTTSDFIADLKTGKGAKLVFQKPDNPVFSGNLYILTNNKTASTCEPIVYMLKKSKRATIIGEKTAGAMLSAAPYEISGKYKLVLPLADFYTYDGVRLDNVGVIPDIETTSENALDKALILINEQ